MGVLGWVLAGQEEAEAVKGVHNELGHLEGIWGDWQTLPALVLRFGPMDKSESQRRSAPWPISALWLSRV